ncbi:unnamed protein product, partial [Mesorhabditis spiculigera]
MLSLFAALSLTVVYRVDAKSAGITVFQRATTPWICQIPQYFEAFGGRVEHILQVFRAITGLPYCNTGSLVPHDHILGQGALTTTEDSRIHVYQSGHCIPTHQFCDRERQCPDGDDKHDCPTVICARNELRCAVDNVCMPLTVRCDGWKDCADGTDELACPATKAVKVPGAKSVASKPTVTCADGSAPEYSL